MNDLLKKLVEAFGPSGFEDHVRAFIQSKVEPFADDMNVDVMGNLIAHKKGDGSGIRVMVAAHMDEIGMMVTHITEEGFLRFTNIGGLYPHTFMGNRVQFANGTIGIIYSDRMLDRTKVHSVPKHFIDVGATGPEDCPVKVGDVAGFTRPLLVQGKRWSGKSLDDRIGCYIAIEALHRLTQTPHEVFFVFSVQEEIGSRGATTAANAIKPEVGIALDVTRTGDIPTTLPMAVRLGGGTAIKVKDSGMIAHRGLVRLMRQRAEEAEIPYQLEVLERGSTDARPMQIAHAGSAAGCISIPCRYIHSQSETVDADDVEGSIQLLVEILSKPIAL